MSYSWWSARQNDRGSLIDDFLAEVDWAPLNSPNQPAIFSTLNGSANIDVSLTSPALHRQVRGWRVHPDLTSTDHRVLSITLGPQHIPDDPRPCRFNTRKANWDRFQERVGRHKIYRPVAELFRGRSSFN